jgi:uncharacterized protein (DUF736 family)
MKQIYDNTNSGALFINDKGDNPSRPDYTGTINVNGKDMRLAGWKKQSKAGKNFLSLKISEMQESSKPAPVKDDGEAPF